jgi:pimeloyl-ACP methyl ester carboxylesterase
LKKRNRKRAFIIAVAAVFLLLLIRAVMPTWTPRIRGERSISEYETVEVNGAEIRWMIRGCDRENPVLIFVHGGPCCSEIPYVRKYQGELEEDFTIVHYDQRGSGKSYRFGEDYSDVTAATHVEDLIAITERVEELLGKDRVILLGHSYGTYIATLAAALRPDLYAAYIGIGQMSDTVESELDTLEKCIARAEDEGDEGAAASLEALRDPIANGEGIVPRSFVRKYGFAARGIDEDRDYLEGFLFGSEYNLTDAVRFYVASGRYQDGLIMEALQHPVTEIVSVMEIPVYFVMGRYDGMTSPEAAAEYLKEIGGDGEREFVLFEDSAHYPQLEEADAFAAWMRERFGRGRGTGCFVSEGRDF